MRDEGNAVGGDVTVSGTRMGPSGTVWPGNPLVVYGIDNSVRSVLFDWRTARFREPETIAARGGRSVAGRLARLAPRRHRVVGPGRHPGADRGAGSLNQLSLQPSTRSLSSFARAFTSWPRNASTSGPRMTMPSMRPSSTSSR